jgi:hypothetical protein
MASFLSFFSPALYGLMLLEVWHFTYPDYQTFLTVVPAPRTMQWKDTQKRTKNVPPPLWDHGFSFFFGSTGV